MDAKTVLDDRISSIRIVSIDSYMRAPILGLDQCYSEFRGNDIKHVPVIRIFGTDAAGVKTCMHVHGVFPYLYVPYSGGDTSDNDADRLSYQLATSLDKAINISLGQTNSSTQHIFKIVVVKGFPFYGYHQKEHQYLKIYLYNPAMVRRTANLLQNGAILNRVYQPHESHLPHILQFMIDYNLYGMSFLYVPSTVIRYRRQQPDAAAVDKVVDEDEFENCDSPLRSSDADGRQWLDKKVERMTTSANEIDIEAAFILNRFQIAQHENAEHANPGIAFIWSDERGRRNKMNGIVPPLQSNPDASQNRAEMAVTESEAFHQEALDRKLDLIRLTSSNDSFDPLNQSNATAPVAPRKFNLNQFIHNAVYPVEYTAESEQSSNHSVLNASFLIDHMRSVRESTQLRHSMLGTSRVDDSPRNRSDALLDDTMVDEELVLSLTQKTAQLDRTLVNETLNEDDYNVLDILQQLEEADEQQQMDESCIEDDSILAPLTQLSRTNSQRQSQMMNLTQRAQHTSFGEEDLDSDDELLNDFSMSMLESTAATTPKAAMTKVPQMDGAYDSDSGDYFEDPSTFNKVKRYANDSDSDDFEPSSYKVKRNTNRTPTRKRKYAPLNITISRNSGRKVDMSSTGFSKTIYNPHSDDLKKFANNHVDQVNGCASESSTATQSLPNGHCESNPSKKQTTEVPASDLHSMCRPVTVKLKRCDDGDVDSLTDEPAATPPPPRRYPKRNRAPPPMYKYEQSVTRTNRPRRTKPVESEYFDSWSNCAVAYRYDCAKNFFPEPGPSSVNYYIGVDLPGYYTPAKPKKRTYSRTRKTTDASADGSSSESEICRTPTPKPKKRGRKSRLSLKRSLKTPTERTPSAIRNTPQSVVSMNETIVDDDDDDIMMQSFYVDSPSMLNHTLIDSPLPNATQSPVASQFDDSVTASVLSKFMSCVTNASPATQTIPESDDDMIDDNGFTRIRSKETAPSRLEVKRALDANEYPQVVNKIPFYSNPKDINPAHRTEVGQTMLHLGGASLNDCEPFASQLNIVGLNSWRKLTLSNMIFPIKNKRLSAKEQGMEANRSFSGSDRMITILPHHSPPSHKEVAKWLLSRNLIVQKNLAPATMTTTVATKTAHANGNGYHVNESETIVIDDDSEPEIDDMNGHDDSEKIAAVTDPLTISNGYDVKPKVEYEEDVICLDDSDDDGKIGNHFKISIISSPSTRAISLNDEKLDKIATEPATDTPSLSIDGLNLDDTLQKTNSQNFSFGITEATLENSYGFKMDLENFQCAKSNIEHNYLTILSLEIHVQTRQNLQPDPAIDAIACIFFAIHNDVPEHLPQGNHGILINSAGLIDAKAPLGIAINVTRCDTERELLMELVRLIRQWDPDIFAGYEIEMSSWGYVMQRSQAIGVDLVPMISRVPSQKVAKFKPKTSDQYDEMQEEIAAELDTEFKLYGRILLDVWRLMRSEINLMSYSFENIMFHVMHRRYPLYAKAKLTELWSYPLHRWIVVDYYAARAKGTLEILGQLDLIGRTCELAKLFGIQFYEVLSRGSQFRVESMMNRIAKPKNLIPVSPSVQQRAHMRSPEYLALIMEPHSRFYADPMIVLDFQSLYPSMIIAYNYCFSTCLGRVEHLGQENPFEFGASQLRVPVALLHKLNRRKLIHIAPCGAVFVKASVREGILPRMLREILDTRLMVKQSMKLHKSDKLLQRVLHSRQLGLKLMANVTYGYTAANFSGRMPCVEVGDSVVSKGRETLERAIKTVESNPKWGCKVVYGDTDSMFVLVPGRTRQDAFRIGAEIAEMVTKENPYPVKLKLEKVYQPSILQTKKRYVGYMYESADQTEAVYEAKGIETVRRDGCPAVAKILEKSLRILFETCDVSAVKQYVCRQFTKILSGHANVQDLIFAKEFRGLHGYKPTACVPSLELTRTARLTDHRAEPRCGERVPYLVINGPPGLPLIRLVRSPHEYLANEGLKINAMYYITKVIIPPLNRCFLLIGADAHQWFADLPRKNQLLLSLEMASKVMTSTTADTHQTTIVGKKSTISQYFSTTNCVCDCGGHTQNGVCDNCLRPERKQYSAVVLVDKCLQLERKVNLCAEICGSCCGQNKDSKCMSLDCSVLFMLNRWKRESKQIEFHRKLLYDQF